MMDDKSIPDVIWSRHVPYEGYVPLQNQDCYHEDTDIQYTRTQTIVELLEGMKVMEYRGISDDDLLDAVARNYVLDDAIKAIKDMK